MNAKTDIAFETESSTPTSGRAQEFWFECSSIRRAHAFDEWDGSSQYDQLV